MPNIKLDRYGRRSFSREAPVLWNELPLSVKSATDLKSFKTSLKTHLFRVPIPAEEFLFVLETVLVVASFDQPLDLESALYKFNT